MLKIKHECVISPNLAPAYVADQRGLTVQRVENPKWPFKVTCKGCQWEALTQTPEQAAQNARGHEALHAEQV